MNLTQPFIRLPWSFDVSRLAAELKQFTPQDWMEHPSRMSGNSAVPLISRNAGNNDEFDGAMQATPHLQRCDYMQQVMAHIGEVYGRSRLMKLSAGKEVSRHVDFNYHWYSRVRIHVPVVTSPDVVFYCGDAAIHMQAGECWIFDSWRHHRVVNGGDADRTHLVFDTSGSSRFWQMVRRMAPHGTNAETLAPHIESVPYRPGVPTTIRTEQFNSAPIMAPGEMAALIDDLLVDLKNNSDNDPEILARYQAMLDSLAKDWREHWHLYGYRRDGWPGYKKLLDGVVAHMDRNPRVLTTQSNDLGVNPIIMQRILRSALKPEMLQSFMTAAQTSS